jgi:hypothetical protein
MRLLQAWQAASMMALLLVRRDWRASIVARQGTLDFTPKWSGQEKPDGE